MMSTFPRSMQMRRQLFNRPLMSRVKNGFISLIKCFIIAMLFSFVAWITCSSIEATDREER
jgi:hypothetical protein